MAVKHASDRFATDSFPGRERLLTASPNAELAGIVPNARQGTHRWTRGGSPEAASAAPVGGSAARCDQVVARTANTANTAVARRPAAAQQLRGTFADSARDRKLVDELIAERRADTLAEWRAADASRPRPGG